MTHVGYYFGIPLQVEVIVCIVFGICFSIFDASLLDLNTNLQKVWAIALDEDKFSDRTELTIKYLLSGIQLVRSFSVHVYLAFYIVMLWPVIFEDKPGLLLPWLTVGAVKSIAASFLSTFTGLFICAMYGLFRPVCLDFLLAQIITHGPSVYVWYVVHSFYEELKEIEALSQKETEDIKQVREAYESELAVRRRKARSMTERQPLHMLDDGRNLISASTIENMLQQLSAQLDRKTSRSLDTMLGLMAAEAEKDDILSLYDDFYTTDESLSVAERTRKLLKLTALEIQEARRRKEERREDGLLKSTTNFSTSTESSLAHSRSYTDHPRPPLLTFPKLMTSTEISPHSSEREIRVVESASSSMVSTLSEVDQQTPASTTSTPVPVKPKSILKTVPKDVKAQPPVVQGSTLKRRKEKTTYRDVTGLSSSNAQRTQPTDVPIYVPSTKKVSPRTHLTNPSKMVTFSKEPIVPVNTEGQHSKLSGPVASFKEDGYMSAYKNKKADHR